MVPAAAAAATAASTPDLLWIYLAIGGILGAASLVLIFLGLFRDKGRGTQRCPHCWYDMHSLLARPAADAAPAEANAETPADAAASDAAISTTPPRCPECGRQAKSLRHLSKRRRRPWLVAAGCLLALLSAAVMLTPTVRAYGWRSAVPTTLLILSLPTGDELLKADLPITFDPTQPAGSALEELVRRWNAGRPPAQWQLRWLCSRMPMVRSRPAWVEDRGYVVVVSIPSWFPQNVSAQLTIDDATAMATDFTTERFMRAMRRSFASVPLALPATSNLTSSPPPPLGAYAAHVYGGAPTSTSHISLKLHTIANDSAWTRVSPATMYASSTTSSSAGASAQTTSSPVDITIPLPTPKVTPDLSGAMIPNTSSQTTQLVANSIVCTLTDVPPDTILSAVAQRQLPMSPYAWLACTSTHAKIPCTVGLRVELLYDGHLADARILVNDDLRFELRKLPVADLADPARRSRYSVRIVPEPAVCLEDIDSKTYWSGELFFDMPATFTSPSTPLTLRPAAASPPSPPSPSSPQP